MARYIDSDKLKERLEIISVVADDLYGMGINRGLDRAETEIDMLPKADVVEVKHGEWFEVDDGIDIGSGKHLECSICGKWKKDRIKSNYCPNCGAKMDGGKKE